MGGSVLPPVAQDQIRIYDLERDAFTRLTFEGASFYPAWSHDGREVFFASNRDGQVRLYRQPVDSSAPAARLLTDEQEALMQTSVRWPSSATPDGRYLVIMTWGHPERGGDLWKVPLDGTSDPEVLLATEHNELIPQVSPDGKRVLIQEPVEANIWDETPITLVTGWADEVARIVGSKG